MSSGIPSPSISPLGGAHDGPLRPDLSGARLRPASPEAKNQVWLVDPEGRICSVDTTRYGDLFRDWSNIVTTTELLHIPFGPNLLFSVLIQDEFKLQPIHILYNKTKRPIRTPAIMDKYHFSYAAVRFLPIGVWDALPTGPDWD